MGKTNEEIKIHKQVKQRGFLKEERKLKVKDEDRKLNY